MCGLPRNPPTEATAEVARGNSRTRPTEVSAEVARGNATRHLKMAILAGESLASSRPDVFADLGFKALGGVGFRV